MTIYRTVTVIVSILMFPVVGFIALFLDTASSAQVGLYGTGLVLIAIGVFATLVNPLAGLLAGLAELVICGLFVLDDGQYGNFAIWPLLIIGVLLLVTNALVIAEQPHLLQDIARAPDRAAALVLSFLTLPFAAFGIIIVIAALTGYMSIRAAQWITLVVAIPGVFIWISSLVDRVDGDGIGAWLSGIVPLVMLWLFNRASNREDATLPITQ